MEAILQQRMDAMEAALVEQEDGSLFLQLADAYQAAGDSERALRVLRRGLESHPAYTPAFELLGHVLDEAGRATEAAVCFEQLLELDPANAGAREALERIAMTLGRPLGRTVPAAGTDARQAAAVPQPQPEPELPDEPRASDGTPSLAVPTSSSAEAPADALPWEASGMAGSPVAAPAVDDARDALEAGLSAGRDDSTAVALADLLVGLLEYRDPFFRGGTSLTRLLTAAIARQLGMDEETTHDVALGAVLRDLGQIPLKGLIDRPGSELGPDGRRRMERHVETALELLDGVHLAQATRATIRHHHERWDGSGYPDRLAGDAIPIGARIVAAADSFAAMIAARPHRLPKRVPAALDDIRAGAGTQYDPAVVDALVRVLSTTNWRGLRFSLRHHVLIVDPDETRAMVLATKLCSHGYLAEAAFSAETARERLQRTRIVGLVISSDLTPAETAALLREVRDMERLGMIPIVMTDAGVSERVALLEAGADVCLARGASFEELKATLEAFLRREGRQLPAGGAQAESWAGLQGDIQDFPLAWLMQVLNYDSRTAAVFLTGGGDEGAIYLDRGNPRHAQTKDLDGEDAFRAMLRWPQGSFRVDPDATTAEQSIRASLMNLLLEQAVQDDHAAFFGSVSVQ
jgi:response regulator RpfG family c-di-GMP phosphodiesterase